jgi:hypothetical protein
LKCLSAFLNSPSATPLEKASKGAQQALRWHLMAGNRKEYCYVSLALQITGRVARQVRWEVEETPMAAS